AKQPFGGSFLPLFREMQLCTNTSDQSHLCKRHQKTAIGEIVSGDNLAVCNLLPQELAVAPFGGEIDGRGRAFFPALHVVQIKGLAEMPLRCTDENKSKVTLLQARRSKTADVFHQPDASNNWRGQDGLAFGFIVERHVA